MASLAASIWDIFLPIKKIWNSPNAMPLVEFQVLKPTHRMLEFCEIKRAKSGFLGGLVFRIFISNKTFGILWSKYLKPMLEIPNMHNSH